MKVVGIPPINGPKNGIMFVTPTIVLISSEYGILVHTQKMKQRIPTMSESISFPLRKPPKIS